MVRCSVHAPADLKPLDGKGENSIAKVESSVNSESGASCHVRAATAEPTSAFPPDSYCRRVSGRDRATFVKWIAGRETAVRAVRADGEYRRLIAVLALNPEQCQAVVARSVAARRERIRRSFDFQMTGLKLIVIAGWSGNFAKLSRKIAGPRKNSFAKRAGAMLMVALQRRIVGTDPPTGIAVNAADRKKVSSDSAAQGVSRIVATEVGKVLRAKAKSLRGMVMAVSVSYLVGRTGCRNSMRAEKRTMIGCCAIRIVIVQKLVVPVDRVVTAQSSTVDPGATQPVIVLRIAKPAAVLSEFLVAIAAAATAALAPPLRVAIRPVRAETTAANDQLAASVRLKEKLRAEAWQTRVLWPETTAATRGLQWNHQENQQDSACRAKSVHQWRVPAGVSQFHPQAFSLFRESREVGF